MLPVTKPYISFFSPIVAQQQLLPHVQNNNNNNSNNNNQTLSEYISGWGIGLSNPNQLIGRTFKMFHPLLIKFLESLVDEQQQSNTRLKLQDKNDVKKKMIQFQETTRKQQQLQQPSLNLSLWDINMFCTFFLKTQGVIQQVFGGNVNGNGGDSNINVRACLLEIQRICAIWEQEQRNNNSSSSSSSSNNNSNNNYYGLFHTLNGNDNPQQQQQQHLQQESLITFDVCISLLGLMDNLLCEMGFIKEARELRAIKHTHYLTVFKNYCGFHFFRDDVSIQYILTHIYRNIDNLFPSPLTTTTSSSSPPPPNSQYQQNMLQLQQQQQHELLLLQQQQQQQLQQQLQQQHFQQSLNKLKLNQQPEDLFFNNSNNNGGSNNNGNNNNNSNGINGNGNENGYGNIHTHHLVPDTSLMSTWNNSIDNNFFNILNNNNSLNHNNSFNILNHNHHHHQNNHLMNNHNNFIENSIIFNHQHNENNHHTSIIDNNDIEIEPNHHHLLHHQHNHHQLHHLQDQHQQDQIEEQVVAIIGEESEHQQQHHQNNEHVEETRLEEEEGETDQVEHEEEENNNIIHNNNNIWNGGLAGLIQKQLKQENQQQQPLPTPTIVQKIITKTIQLEQYEYEYLESRRKVIPQFLLKYPNLRIEPTSSKNSMEVSGPSNAVLEFESTVDKELEYFTTCKVDFSSDNTFPYKVMSLLTKIQATVDTLPSEVGMYRPMRKEDSSKYDINKTILYGVESKVYDVVDELEDYMNSLHHDGYSPKNVKQLLSYLEKDDLESGKHKKGTPESKSKRQVLKTVFHANISKAPLDSVINVTTERSEDIQYIRDELQYILREPDWTYKIFDNLNYPFDATLENKWRSLCKSNNVRFYVNITNSIILMGCSNPVKSIQAIIQKDLLI